jgi:hypothetical protein
MHQRLTSFRQANVNEIPPQTGYEPGEIPAHLLDSVRKRFAHRSNSDGTFDSICRSCYITIATDFQESDLQHPEEEHLCDLHILRQDRLRWIVPR